MMCMRCDQTLAECRCPDADARAREISDLSHVVLKWCKVCDRYYAHCRCATPDFGLRSGGKLEDIPAEGLLTAAGTRVFPSRTER